MINSFYTENELAQLGFAKIGKNVLISRKASIYGADKMVIGNNVRIDDFCILSGNIILGDFIHIAAYTALYGGDEGIEFKNYSTISSHSSVYSMSDDYSGEYMTNPMVPECYRNTKNARVIIGEHVIIGSHSVILPGCVLETGVSVGAMGLVTSNLKEWGIYVGIPCTFLKQRKKIDFGDLNDYEEGI